VPTKSVEETDILSAGSKGENENQFLQDNNLTILLNRLQNNDEFLHEIIKIVKGLQDTPLLLKSEKMRPKFTAALKKQWENSENLILLSMLHHSELLKLFLSTFDNQMKAINMLTYGNVREQLSQICSKKNDILNRMVIDLQSERELVQTVETIIELFQEHIKQMEKEEEERRLEKERLEAELKKQPEEGAMNSKDVLKQKLEDLSKKYDKKKVGKKSDHIVPKKDPKKESKLKKEQAKKEAEAVPEPIKQVEVMEEKPAPVAKKLQYEAFLTKPELTEPIAKILRESKMSEPKLMEYILQTRGLEYRENDLDHNKKEVLKFLNSLVVKCESDPASLENPYSKIANRIDERCFFLLKLSTKFSQSNNEFRVDENQVNKAEERSEIMDEEDEEDLAPMDVTRSLSSAAPQQRKNSKHQEPGMENLEKRVDILQEWINSYKKWKNSNSNANLESDNCSFLISISSFLTLREPVEIKRLEKSLLRVAQRACFRALGLDMIKEFLNFSSDTWLSRYVTGIFSTPFK
jgi:hypothetical protein